MTQEASQDRHLITKEEVEHIAELAKIELTEDQKNTFSDQLDRILEYFKKIDELELEDVEPTTHVMDVYNVFRKDEEKESLPQEEVLENAPEKEDDYIKAPRVG